MPSCSRGVLRREHEEGIGQAIGFVTDGDLTFLHGLEEGALHLGGRTVDFVGEHEVRKDGAVLGTEDTVLRIVDLGAHDVGREHVGRELQPFEAHRDGARQGLQGQGLGEAGDALEQHVAVGEQRDQQAVHQVFLADDDAGDLQLQGFDPGGVFEHGVAGGALGGIAIRRQWGGRGPDFGTWLGDGAGGLRLVLGKGTLLAERCGLLIHVDLFLHETIHDCGHGRPERAPCVAQTSQTQTRWSGDAVILATVVDNTVAVGAPGTRWRDLEPTQWPPVPSNATVLPLFCTCLDFFSRSPQSSG